APTTYGRKKHPVLCVDALLAVIRLRAEASGARGDSGGPTSDHRGGRTVIVGAPPGSVAGVVAGARGAAAAGRSPPAPAAPAAGRKVIDALANDTAPHYGVSTGFGALATRHIPAELRLQLQRSLVRSHAAGSGQQVEVEVVRAMMLLRLSTLATGRTGVRLE